MSIEALRAEVREAIRESTETRQRVNRTIAMMQAHYI